MSRSWLFGERNISVFRVFTRNSSWLRAQGRFRRSLSLILGTRFSMTVPAMTIIPTLTSAKEIFFFIGHSKPAATSSASCRRALPGKSRRRNFEHGFDHGPFQRMATTRQSGNLTRVRGELKPSKKAQAERWPLQQPVIIALSFLLNRQVWE